MKKKEKPIIGIIGTGWVGSSYLKAFKTIGYDPICYSLDPQFIDNKKKIEHCDIVLIAVPTPTTSTGFDDAILRDVMSLVGKDKIAVIKSTVLPGTTDSIQSENPEIIVIHSPEFLSMATAEYDAINPKRNIIGLPVSNEKYQEAAQYLIEIFPKAPFDIICTASEAEVIKYAHNCGGYLRIVFNNILYDISQKFGAQWEPIKNAMLADPDNAHGYLDPVHKNGRGAGGPCFIKDFAAFTRFYKGLEDDLGFNILTALENKNISLLMDSKKDIDIINSLYQVPPEELA